MSATALERQLRPIYDSLDTGSNKSAIVACNKLLKKHPKNDLIKALKALALVRSQKVEESLILCDEVLASKPTDDAILTAMMHVLRGLGRHADMVSMFEEAFKKQPTNEELGAQTFFANVRAGHWKSAQQVATKMHKQFQEDRYLYWSVISTVLQANDPTTNPAIRDILYKLAHRLITSSASPSYYNADRFYLHLSILRELKLFEEAHKLLDHDVGKALCATSLACNELRRDIWGLQGLLREEGELAEQKITQQSDRNWLEFLSVVDATYLPSRESEGLDNTAKIEQIERIGRVRNTFEQIAEQDGSKDRSGSLALLELEKRAREHGLSTDSEYMITLLKRYFEQFGDKACCYEDLRPYISLTRDSLSSWTTYLESLDSSFTTDNDLRKRINVLKLLRHNFPESQLTIETEFQHANLYAKDYLDGLKLGAGLPSSELQPADDLAILSASSFVSLWTSTRSEKYLFNAVVLLEFALAQSRQSFIIRLMLVRIYRLLGASSLALEHYRAMQIKQVQHDTLSHHILSRSSTFSLAAAGDLTLATECLESCQIYISNSQETADFVVRAFTSEKYSQIPEFIAFEDRLDNSLQRDMIKVEHVRMRFAHEMISSDIIDMELIELKFIFDRNHHDNRDFGIIPNYQPGCQPSFHEQTLLFGKVDGFGWLTSFLKIYIKALQQASDLDDTVEEKLLIGDRPKQRSNPESSIPLKERLRERRDEELLELTADEISFARFADALADWLEPYHDYARPPPSVVLAEAAKQSEMKTGHPLKGIDIPAQNGSPNNGPVKKDEEPPIVKEPPKIVDKFFDDMKARFEEVLQAESLVDVLHIASLIQEAFVLLVIETIRFKSPSVVKVYKLSALVQSFKTIRSNALTVMRDVSTALSKKGEQEGSADRRKTFVDVCTDMTGRLEINHDFVLNTAKKVTESRKKVLDGYGRGMARICSNYSQ